MKIIEVSRCIQLIWVSFSFLLIGCQISTPSQTEMLPKKLDSVELTESLEIPLARVMHTMAYDEERKVVVLFGGQGKDGHLLNDTWEYDGSAWRRIQPPLSPSARAKHAMAYYPGRETTILLGGMTENEDFTNDVWEFNGQTWHQLETPSNLSPRSWPSIVHEDSSQTILLFGGSGQLGQKWDTWQFDGIVWRELNIEPPVTGAGATTPQMGYDSVRNVAVLLGLDGETFEFDGFSWKRILGWEDERSLYGVTVSLGVKLAYDSQRKMILTLVKRHAVATAETWEYDGTKWYQVTVPESPPGRVYYAMAYDEERGVIVLFGGADADGNLLNDTWEYDGISWVQK